MVSDFVLTDEPLGPLDAQTRLLLQDDLRDLWQTRRKTILFGTHDLTEAIAMADRMILMSARPGRIVRIDQVERLHRTKRDETSPRSSTPGLANETAI